MRKVCRRSLLNLDRRGKDSRAALPGISDVCRRGSVEERAVPSPDHRRQHRYRHRSRARRKNNCWSNCGDRRGRMHDHAQRAMIRIDRRWVDVRHLDHRHQSQQQHTQQRRRAHSPGPAVANQSLLSAQIQGNSSLIQEYTEIRRGDVNYCCSKKNATAGSGPISHCSGLGPALETWQNISATIRGPHRLNWQPCSWP